MALRMPRYTGSPTQSKVSREARLHRPKARTGRNVHGLHQQAGVGGTCADARHDLHRAVGADVPEAEDKEGDEM